MDDSGAILGQVSHLKDMLDQVNGEIEVNIHTTREIESEIVKCSEIENGFAMRESELMKSICVQEFEMNGLNQVATIAKTSMEQVEKELSCLRDKRDDVHQRINRKRCCLPVFLVDEIFIDENNHKHSGRQYSKPAEFDRQFWETFIVLCENFQRDINKGENEEICILLSEKEALENEIHVLNMNINALRNSVSEFIEDTLEDLNSCNSALNVEIQSKKLENEKYLEDINDLKMLLRSMNSNAWKFLSF